MGTLLLSLQLLPVVIEAVTSIERTNMPKGSGKDKLALVVGAVDSVLSNDAVTGLKIPKVQVIALVTNLVNMVVKTFNASGVFAKAA